MDGGSAGHVLTRLRRGAARVLSRGYGCSRRLDELRHLIRVADIATCPETISTVVAPMRLANWRSASGGMASSFPATRYQAGPCTSRSTRTAQQPVAGDPQRQRNVPAELADLSDSRQTPQPVPPASCPPPAGNAAATSLGADPLPSRPPRRAPGDHRPYVHHPTWARRTVIAGGDAGEAADQPRAYREHLYQIPVTRPALRITISCGDAPHAEGSRRRGMAGNHIRRLCDRVTRRLALHGRSPGWC